MGAKGLLAAFGQVIAPQVENVAIPAGVDAFKLSLDEIKKYSSTKNFEILGHSYFRIDQRTPWAKGEGGKRLGALDTQLVYEFFQGFVNHAQVTLHVDNLKGVNAHHQAETAFKAFGRALRMAVEVDPRVTGVPSTKGSL